MADGSSDHVVRRWDSVEGVMLDMNDDIRVPAEHRILPWVVALGVAAIVVGASLALVLPRDSDTPQVTVRQ
jgi:hypothetical protein